MSIICIIFLFCFIIVGSGLQNIALNKKTVQSSTEGNELKGRGSHLANDGNLEQIADNGVCSHTSFTEPSFWWTVDLKDSYQIETVIIYGRTDCCQYRLADFDILLYNPLNASWSNYDKHPGKLCYHQNGVAPVILKVTCAKNVEGRFLKIVKKNNGNGDDCLTLCEVQVFGQKPIIEEMCPCSCSYKERKTYRADKHIPNRTMEEWRKILSPVLAKIDTELRINKTQLSGNRRRKNSANDNRKSAKCLGIIGAVFLVFVVALVIFIDIVAIRKGLQAVRRIHHRI